ncbi:MAG: glycosyltransferase family 39 protein [Coleofasciculaceae cyanobacterium]
MRLNLFSQRLPAKWRILFILVLVLGIFFRFYNLGGKVYWHDEVYTSIRSSGYTGNEVVEDLFDGRIISVEDLQKYQRLSPEKDLGDTINSLVQHPEHPPLYYLILRFWRQLFGDSVVVNRSLSASISLLAFPCLFWLCQELFNSPAVGWMAIAFFAVSPFQVLYAQEAREYSLWTVTILLSSATLIRSINLTKSTYTKPRLSWLIYVVSLTLSFYTSLLSALVAISHFLYVLSLEKFRLSKLFSDYLVALSAAVIAFLPWIFVIINNLLIFKEKTGWTNTNVSLSFLAKMWGLHLSSIFFDFGLELEHPFTYFVPPCLLILVIYAIYFLCRQTDKPAWLFILTLISVTALFLILSDLVFGGQRSSISRYFIPCYLGIQIAIAYLLTNKNFSSIFSQIQSGKKFLILLYLKTKQAFAHLLNPKAYGVSPSQEKRQLPYLSTFYSKIKLLTTYLTTIILAAFSLSSKNIWQMLTIVLFTGGVVSCFNSSQAETWWNKIVSYHNPKIAEVINQTPQPLVISNTTATNAGDIISLSYLLDEKVKFQLVVNPNIPKIPNGFSHIFLFHPSQQTRQGIEQKYNAKVALVDHPDQIPLWQLVK